jgi:2-polyprenyl-3-methyl-5-hydroxy-6-metoxy-1,4-benzoquinol methylase
MKHEQSWIEAQTWELDWHLHQQFNTYNEETKQYIYASKMGLDPYQTNYYNQIGWDFKRKTVLDVGGGEQSILLKVKAQKRVVVDPLDYPLWTKMRYQEAGIEFLQIRGEDMQFADRFDIGIIYNCLQHTENPQKIIHNMKACCNVIHLFEWVETGLSEGHIHDLTEKALNEWLGGYGKVEQLDQFPCIGRVYYGIFKGDRYIS